MKRNLNRVQRDKDDSEVAEHVFEGVRAPRTRAAHSASVSPRPERATADDAKPRRPDPKRPKT